MSRNKQCHSLDAVIRARLISVKGTELKIQWTVKQVLKKRHLIAMLHILYDANEEQEHLLIYKNKYILVKFRFASKPTMDNYDKDSRGHRWAVVNRNTHILMFGDKPLPEVTQKLFPDVHFIMASAKWRLFCSCVNAFKIVQAINPGLGVTKPIFFRSVNFSNFQEN